MPDSGITSILRFFGEEMKRILLSALVISNSLLATPKLFVEPREPMLDEQVKIVVMEAPPKSRVKVMASLRDERGRQWTSSGVFLSDENGSIDLTAAAPIEGSYDGVDPMGLFWSMELKEKEKDRTLFRHGGLDPMEVALAAQLENGTVVQNKVVRRVAKDGLVSEKVTDGGIVGTFIRPKGKGPFPAVIVLGGACGGIPQDSYVAQLANQGYATLGLAYFFASGLPEHLNHVPIEFVEKAVKWLCKNKVCDVSKLSVLGTSMGGVYALLAASYFPEVKSAVIFDGAGVVFQSLDSGKALNTPVAPFSFQDKPLPFLSLDIPQPNEENFKTSFFLRTFLSSYFSKPKEEKEEAAIKVEKINGPVLLMGTLDDQLFGSAYQLQQVYNRLVEHRFPHEYDFVAYCGAGHMIGIGGLPYSPTTSSALQLRQNKMIFCVGGNPKDSSKAQVDSWKRTFAFLKKATNQVVK